MHATNKPAYPLNCQYAHDWRCWSARACSIMSAITHAARTLRNSCLPGYTIMTLKSHISLVPMLLPLKKKLEHNNVPTEQPGYEATLQNQDNIIMHSSLAPRLRNRRAILSFPLLDLGVQCHKTGGESLSSTQGFNAILKVLSN